MPCRCLRTLAANDVTTCFMNPGTSEMHFVAALDDVPEVRGVLCLFEGVASGAADGYARVAGAPAATLLHLGPGLGNAFANLHNARRAHSPVLNVVGDHATYHSRYDAPLQTDIAALAGALEGWYRRTARADDVAGDAADAIAAAFGPPGARRHARAARRRLVVADDLGRAPSARARDARVAARRNRRRGRPSRARCASTPRARSCSAARRCGSRGLAAAARVAHATGCRVLHETFPAVLDRGPGLLAPERLNYLGELALAAARRRRAAGPRRRRLAGQLLRLPEPALAARARGLRGRRPRRARRRRRPAPSRGSPTPSMRPRRRATPHERRATPRRPTGALDRRTLLRAPSARSCPRAASSSTSPTPRASGSSRRRGTPAATSGSRSPAARSATACPRRSARRSRPEGRRVLCLESDGSMTYTPQALWTMAREGLDVTTVCCSNDSYAILNFELARVGATASGERARAMLDLTGPTLDLAKIAEGYGVPASTATSADELVVELEKALATDGADVHQRAPHARLISGATPRG